MTEGKKKVIEYAIGFAISVAASYFVIYVRFNDLFSWPSYAYNTLFIFVGVLLLFFLFSFLKFLIVRYRGSKQVPYFPSFSYYGGRRPEGRYELREWRFEGLIWKVEYFLNRKELYQIRGPYCPKDGCGTELNVMRTAFGRYRYVCPACSFKTIKTESSYTLEYNLEKVSKSQFEKDHGVW